MELLTQLLPGPYSPWLPGAIALVLLATAAWDAWKGIVPNIPLLIGGIAIGVGRFLANGWQDALIYVALGLGAWGAIWLFNEGWYRFFKRDAVGMGDAKWTALAVAAFGIVPALFAWFAGSWVAILWIIGAYAIKKPIRKVYFAPFLFCGLIIGLVFTQKIVELPFPFIL
jgi:prepilin signal peptidase PulO-like enzyme (type II secretory pathway)